MPGQPGTLPSQMSAQITRDVTFPDQRAGQRLSVAVTLGDFVNVSFKLLAFLPRPYILSPQQKPDLLIHQAVKIT